MDQFEEYPDDYGTDVEPDGGIRPCVPNDFGFCKTCGEDMQ